MTDLCKNDQDFNLRKTFTVTVGLNVTRTFENVIHCRSHNLMAIKKTMDTLLITLPFLFVDHSKIQNHKRKDIYIYMFASQLATMLKSPFAVKQEVDRTNNYRLNEYNLHLNKTFLILCSRTSCTH